MPIDASNDHSADHRKTDHEPARIEPLEPRLLLSASTLDSIQNQQDFAEYLDSVGLGNLDQYDVSITIDIPDGYIAASAAASEQLASMAAAGLNAIGSQPVGALTGKIVYLHGGHGLTANENGSWGFQRPEIEEIVEDLSNQDMMTFLADFLWRAGATIVPLRPIGHQTNEVIIDNDDAEVTYVGSWGNSTQSVFYGSPGDTPYRYASTSATETAYARYRPDIPEAGYYPVYTWVHDGSDRVNQLYKVTHSGGTTEVRVDHRMVGDGLVYLGTYYFEQGTDGYVDISNENSESGNVIADMIRFGNGMGDIAPYGTISGTSRENEPGVYWIAQNLGQGISASTAYGSLSSTVSAPPRFAAFMNNSAAGSLSDRVFISYHSNAGGGRGAVGLHNTNSGGATPNQFLLADILGGKVNDDMSALNGTFEHDWSTRTSDTYQADFNYGEINNSYINDEFDATILEWAFHDSSLDLDLMRDADVRIAVARATYQGLQQYFNTVDGGATGLTFLPDPVTDVMTETNGDGTVTVSWTPPAYLAVGGDTPTGYMIYTSLNGYGFDGGTYVAGGSTTSFTMTGLDYNNGTHYFKVVAVNAGGESLGSSVVAATPLPAAAPSKVLIVNGFDRVDRTGNDREAQPNGYVVDRIRLQYQNSGDYAVQIGEALEAFNPAIAIDTVQNENVTSLDIDLTDYDTVIWILGEESTADQTFSTAEQFLVDNFVSNGGDLLVSGSEIGWDLDASGNGASFYNNTLGGDYVSDDAGSYSVNGVAGSIFEGLSFSFDNGTLFYNVDYPDVINPSGGSQLALTYSTGGGAAVQKKGSTAGDVVMLAFPFETITTASDRADVMAAIMDFFGAPPSEIPGPPSGIVATPGDNSIGLDWSDNTEEDILGYNVLRSLSEGGTYTQINISTVLVSEFVDNDVFNGVTYYYKLEAIDNDLNVSEPSIAIDATPDDYASDKNGAITIAIPSTTDGNMGSADSDWFGLSLTAGTEYIFTLTNDGLSSGGLRLYTASGSTILATNDGPASGSTLAQIVYTPTFSTTYYIVAVGNGGASGDYQLTVQEADDHGNSIAEATELPGAFGLGKVEVSGDVDYFHVPVVEGMTYTFGVLDLGLPDAILNLYNNGGAIISQNIGSNPGSTHAQINWLASADGYVYLSVAAQAGSLGQYAVTISATDQLDGDLNSDGFVGLDDLDIVLNNWNQNVTAGEWSQGDPSGDGFVGLDDLDIVLNNWNNGTPAAATASATETLAASTSESTQPVQTQQQRQTQQQQTQRQTRQQQQVQTQPVNTPLLGNWQQTQSRSAFASQDDDSLAPTLGLWEADKL